MYEHKSLHSIEVAKSPLKKSDYFPVGIAFVLSISILFWLFTSVSPQRLKDVLIPNSYLPVVLIVMITSCSGVLVLTKNVIRGLMWGMCLTLIVWMLLQQVLDIKVFLYLVIPFVLCELTLTVGKKK